MRIHRSFQQGDLVQIIDPSSPQYSLLVTIVSIKDGKCIVKLEDGQNIELSLHDLGPVLDYRAHKTLYRAHLIQMQLLAVDLGDRKWFDELKEIIEKLDFLP